MWMSLQFLVVLIEFNYCIWNTAFIHDIFEVHIINPNSVVSTLLTIVESWGLETRLGLG